MSYGTFAQGNILSHKKKEKKKILPFATAWMELENIVLSETSQSEEDTHHRISLTCGI